MSDEKNPDYYSDFDVAIIGMSGRFPGAKNVREFWQNIKNSVESISFFSDEELLAAGADPEMIKNPSYVRARGIIEDIDKFDATLFGYFPREAELMDPQQRLFLECAWEALENAGYDAERYDGLIGTFGGVGLNIYLLSLLRSKFRSMSAAEIYQYVIGNDKDFLTTRVSYKMNLRGPSCDVQTACSTSLVAVYLAYQSLTNFQCDMALAGGSTIVLPQQQGYLYQEGMILSPDGHCRPFDARAGGTIGGNGVGVVVLKRLSDAINDGDHVYAIIRGAACNNDGSNRVGFTAPGVEGQAEVVAMAQAVANVEPETISYIETHGTGTTLGDPIEIAALTQVFRERTDKKQFCALGAVKANVGHLDTAAGVTGLIKTALALNEKVLPPSVNFEQPNPRIDFTNSPFFVNRQLKEWKTFAAPRRAGLSSFGIGGTNVHVIMEEAPEIEPSGPSRKYQLITLSAKTETAVDSMITKLAGFLKENPAVNLADLAFTFHLGRKTLEHRRTVLAQSVDDLVNTLEKRDPQKILGGYHPADKGEPSVVFMFSGQGAQYPNMGLELYQTESAFREQVDYCAEILKSHLGFDLREVLFPADDQLEQAAQKLNETHVTQPALFVIEYALAKLWMEWGIEPQAMIGHSIGEYVAACLAGVFSLDDALKLVAARGRFMQSMPGGAMLSVPVDEKEVQPLLNENLSLAAVNAPSLCVISGTFEAIEQLEKKLTEKGMEFRRLHTSHAFHSPMMEPILAPFIEEVKKVKLNPPQIPYLSNVTGTWITVEEATDPKYWAKHLRHAVRFGDGIKELLEDPNCTFLEVGPGNTLSTLARRVPSKTPGRVMLSSIRHPKEKMADVEFLSNTLGRLWLAGAKIDWQGFYAHEQRHRIPAPSYPFERQRYWIQEEDHRTHEEQVKQDASRKQSIERWFYSPSWKRADLPMMMDEKKSENQKIHWLLFVEKNGLSSQIVNRLINKGQDVTTIMIGSQFEQINDHVFMINPLRKNDYGSLFQSLKEKNKIPERIVHCWNIEQHDRIKIATVSFDNQQNRGFCSMIYIAQALGKQNITTPIKIDVLSTGLHEVIGTEDINPDKATLFGACRVMPQEYPNLTCRSIDFDGSLGESDLVNTIIREISSNSTDITVAYRGRHRWVQIFEMNVIRTDENKIPRLRDRGVYLITGGLGRIGLTFAEHLAQKFQAKLALADMFDFPAKKDWEKWLKNHQENDGISQRIKKLQSFEEAGAEVLVIKAEAADENAMAAAIDQAVKTFRDLNGVIHAAGIVGERSMKPIQEVDEADWREQFQAKVHGTKVLAKVLQDRNLDFCMLQSSLSSILGGLGMAAYSAANSFMDAFVAKEHQSNLQSWVSVNWEGWLFEEDFQNVGIGADMLQLALKPEEGIQAFEKILATNGLSQVVVSTGNLQSRIERWLQPHLVKEKERAGKPKASSLHPRPNLPNPYVAPRNDLEQEITAMWQELLGIEPIGIYDNFFELGGHSLLATQLVSRMRDTFKVELPLRELFESPSIATLSGAIEKQRSDKQKADESVANLLQMVDQMSDEDARKLLEQKRGLK